MGDIKKLLERVDKPTLFLGKAAYLYHRIIVDNIGHLAKYRDEMEGEGSVVALLALSRLKRGESDDALSLTPLYLKESAAQALLARRITIA